MRAKSALTLLILLCLVPWITIHAQTPDSSKNVLTLDIHYGAGLPFSDLKERFGEHFMLGGNITYLSKSNLMAGINYDFIFGSQVHEDVLSNLRTIEGGIIGRSMEFASVYLRERGHHLNAEAGYFFSIEKNSSISGFFILGGVGYLRHKVRIVDEFNAVVQLFDPYDRGYDRLTGGWSITQKVGYQFLSKDKLVNLRISAALTEGFTKDVRKFNYNKTESKSSRTDILASLQIAWIVPIYLTKEIRYY